MIGGLFVNQSALFRWTLYCSVKQTPALVNEMSAHLFDDGTARDTEEGRAFDRWLREERYALVNARPAFSSRSAAEREVMVDEWLRERHRGF